MAQQDTSAGVREPLYQRGDVVRLDGCLPAVVLSVSTRKLVRARSVSNGVWSKAWVVTAEQISKALEADKLACKETLEKPCQALSLGARVTFFDLEDLGKIWPINWHAAPRNNGVFYAKGNNGGGSVYMHRIIAGAPVNAVVDHKDHDGLNNRRANLRVGTVADNAHNHSGHGNPHGFKGVFRSPGARKWQARITVLGKAVLLGSHATPELAALAYDTAAKEHFGRFAKLNFPEAEDV